MKAASVALHDLGREEALALRLPEEAAARRAPRYASRSEPALEALAIVAMGGVMAEISEFGDAEGGSADLALLQRVRETAPDEGSAISGW